MTNSPPSLVDLLPRIASEDLDQLLAEHVTFSSPVADYHGRADVAHLLRCIGRVLEDPLATSTASDGTRLTMLTASVEGRPVEGILRERHDRDGHLVHATLFLRPYRTLQTAINAMVALLREDPLPSTRP